MVKEYFGNLDGVILSYFGDGNNVVNFLLLGCVMVGINVKIVILVNYMLNKEIVEEVNIIVNGKSKVIVINNF